MMETEESKWTVAYNIAGATGTVIVWADANSSREHVIALAKAQIVSRCYGTPLPMGHESFDLVREDA